MSVSGRPSRHLGITTQDYELEHLKRDLIDIGPDLLIGEYVGHIGAECRVARIGKVGIGILPAKEYIEYLENIMRLPQKEGWSDGGRI